MNVIAIDPGKNKTGVFIRNSGIDYSYVFKGEKKETEADALVRIYYLFCKLVDNENYHFAIIENPRNTAFNTLLYEIIGVIKLVLFMHDIPVISIYSATWRAVTIKDLDKKNYKSYLNQIEKKYDKKFSTTDEADAYLMYLAVREIGKKTTRLTKGMRRIKDQLSGIIEGGNIERSK